MDRITLTWEDALADPSATAMLLRSREEEAEEYIAQSRAMRQWLASVPPLAMPKAGRSPRTAPPEYASDASSHVAEEPLPQDDVQDDHVGEPPSPGSGDGHQSRPREDGGRNRSAGGSAVPPQREADGNQKAQRGPVEDQDTASTPSTGEGGPAQEATLHERVEELLRGLAPRTPQTARGIAEMIGHTNLRSLRPVLDRMAVQGLLVKTQLHPRAVVYHRPEAGAPEREATMF
ncbi:hypothetical protein [Streptomyces sp. NPDC002530]